MKNYRICLILGLVVVSFVLGCKNSLGDCAETELMDHRFGGALASPSAGLCIPKEVTLTNHGVKGTADEGEPCWGTHVQKDLPEGKVIIYEKNLDGSDKLDENGNKIVKKADMPTETKCLTGCPPENVEGDSCNNSRVIGHACTVIGDCIGDAVCLADPLVITELAAQFNTLALIDEDVKKALIEYFQRTNVTPDLVISLGINYCTKMECDPFDEKSCPGDSKCQDLIDATPLAALGIKAGLNVCYAEPKAEEPEDTDETPDGNGSSSDVCPETCAKHDECKIPACETDDRTFCTGEIEAFLPEGTPLACAIRCDPADDQCPEGYVCNGAVSALPGADGAKGICAPN